MAINAYNNMIGQTQSPLNFNPFPSPTPVWNITSMQNPSKEKPFIVLFEGSAYGPFDEAEAKRYAAEVSNKHRQSTYICKTLGTVSPKFDVVEESW